MTDKFVEFFEKGGKPISPASTKEPQSFEKFFGYTPERIEAARKQREAAAALIAPYEAVMKDYVHNSRKDRWSFWEGDPNQGYKFHLNVKPENVQKVSEFLRQHDYEHKYLSGGEPDDGKIFTVYAGSKEQTELVVREVTDSIDHLLEPPLAAEEPYAPHIVGRFCGDANRFEERISVNGVTLLRHTESLGRGAAFTRADAALKQTYGDYYGGGITFYQSPNKS